jgi:hypothetical protein
MTGDEREGALMAQEAATATIICTVGMHRSGTSVVSRLLNLLGAHLGSDDSMMRAAGDNPKGFWEHQPLVMINEEILRRFGGCWDAPPVFPPAWAEDPVLEDLRARAREILANEFGSTPLWGFKDPRSSITLPFWQAVIGPMRYVICLRGPNAVVGSLADRDRMETRAAERLWLTHVHASLLHTRDQPRMVVYYDDILDDWRVELRRLAAFIGRPDRAEDPAVQRAVRDFLEADLRHHDGAAALLAADRQLSAGTAGLYLALRSSCHPFDEALELFAARALEAWDDAAALSGDRERLSREVQALDERNRVLAADEAAARDSVSRLESERQDMTAERGRLAADLQSLEEQVRTLTASRDATLATIAGLEANLASLSSERDDLAVRLRTLHVALDHSRQELSARESEARQSIARLGADLEQTARDRDRYLSDSLDTARTLREIQTSSAWRLVTASRSAIVRYLPAETRRRRVFNSVLRRITGRLPPPSDLAASSGR